MHKKKLKSIFLGSRIEAYKVLDELTNVIGIIPIKNSYVHKNKKNIIVLECFIIFIKYIFFTIMVTVSGYLWFLINYPALPSGDTNKAVYKC